MKIINESKEKLPIDFMTQFISNGWNEVGNLKASVDAIKSEFTNTKDIVKILEDLSDAYLIAIGQAQKYLQTKEYIDAPKESDLKEALQEELPDAKVLGLDEPKKEVVEEPAQDEMAKVEEEQPTVESLNEDIIINVVEAPKPQEPAEEFEYFCDFDDPVGEALTDADVYPFVNEAE